MLDTNFYHQWVRSCSQEFCVPTIAWLLVSTVWGEEECRVLLRDHGRHGEHTKGQRAFQQQKSQQTQFTCEISSHWGISVFDFSDHQGHFSSPRQCPSRSNGSSADESTQGRMVNGLCKVCNIWNSSLLFLCSLHYTLQRPVVGRSVACATWSVWIQWIW